MRPIAWLMSNKKCNHHQARKLIMAKKVFTPDGELVKGFGDSPCDSFVVKEPVVLRKHTVEAPRVIKKKKNKDVITKRR